MEESRPGKVSSGGGGRLPEIDLRHVIRLTDDTGILQHARHATGDRRHGYCTDDNARALIAAVHAARLGRDEVLAPLERYAAFLCHAFDRDAGRFRNFMGYDRRWLEDVGSDDSHGRAVWGLGVAVSAAAGGPTADLAAELFAEALPALDGMRPPRAWAFALVGIDEFLRARPGDDAAARVRELLAGRLFAQRERYGSDGWPWWEDVLTYANAKLPHALLVSGAALGREDMVEAALASLRWLLDVQTAEAGHLSIIGNRGWYVRGGARARFDQQPLEAHALVHACLDAARVTGDATWAEEARRAFEWFTGLNDLGIALCDPATGGCCDGLMSDGVNRNQGAESTLAYVLSVLELHVHARGREAAGGL